MSSNSFIDKARLSEQEKKSNHIASEQKRRQAIREGFDRLCDLVPNMAGQGRSEAVVLQATVHFMREQLTQKDEMKERAMGLGMSEGDFEQVYREELARASHFQEGQ